MTDQKRSHIFESANHLIYETHSFPRQLCVKLCETHPSFSWWGVDHSISWCWAQQEGQLRELSFSFRGFDFLSWSFIVAEIWQYFLGKNGNLLPLSIHRCACYHGSWTPSRQSSVPKHYIPVPTAQGENWGSNRQPSRLQLATLLSSNKFEEKNNLCCGKLCSLLTEAEARRQSSF